MERDGVASFLQLQWNKKAIKRERENVLGKLRALATHYVVKYVREILWNEKREKGKGRNFENECFYYFEFC